jgi:hypothetical protein
MKTNEIIFRGLPFQPEPNQVFFIESGYDQETNEYIQNFQGYLTSLFESKGLKFDYLPSLVTEEGVEEKVRYYAPYLTSEELTTPVRSDALTDFILDSETRKNLPPSFIFGGIPVGYEEDYRFLQVPLFEVNFDAPYSFFMELKKLTMERMEAAEKERLDDRVLCSPSASPDIYLDSDEVDSCTMQMPQFKKIGREAAPEKTEEQLEEERSLIDTQKVLEQLRRTVQKLRLDGVSLMAIHEFIDKQEPLSRMVITPDYRIFLPDYHNMEIEMGALPKAIYFLFLRYPEGIVYKLMQDYFTELLNIYKQLRPNTDEARLHVTITKVVNPLGNALNENLARIRKAFVEKFDEHLACHYIVSGERGSQYLIPLDRELITWEE